MAKPAGITSRTLTFGAAFDLINGTDMSMKVIVDPNRSMVWRATGSPGIAIQQTFEAGDGLQHEMDVPITDQVGWGDGNGNLIDVSGGKQSHLYRVTIKYFRNNREVLVSESKWIAVPLGDGSPIDLDDMIPAGGAGGATIFIPDTWDARISELEALITTTGSFIGSQIATNGTPAEVAVAAKIEALDATDLADTGYDIWLLAGQSNMKSQAPTTDVKIDVLDPRVYQYGNQGTYADIISQAVDPLAHHEQGTGVGCGTVFARDLAYRIKSNRRILLVPVAHGGVPFVGPSSGGGSLTWDPAATVNASNLYENAITQALAALANGGEGSRIVGVLWCHGESDAINATSAATYQEKLLALIDGLRTRLAAPDLLFIMGQMGVPATADTVAAKTAIQNVQRAVVGLRARTAFAYGPYNLDNGDGLHYNSPGQRALGHNLFDALPYAIANTAPGVGAAIPVPADVAGLTAVQGFSTSVQLRWTPVADATSYIVHYKTSASSTWLAANGATAAKATVTGLAPSTSYDFRVRARNAGGSSTSYSSSVTASTTALFSATDTFTRADGALTVADTGQAYVMSPTPWRVVSNEAAPASGNAANSVATIDTGNANHSAQAIIRANGGGVVARVTDETSFYVATQVTSGDVLLYKRTNSTTIAQMGSTVTGGVVGDVLKIEAIGSAIKVYRNGTQIISVTDTALTSATKAGLWANTAAPRLDSLVVAEAA